MVAWTTPPTFASPWNFSDANTYARDNMISERYCQRSPFYTVQTFTATSVNAVGYTSPTLLTATLNEIVRLNVLINAQYQSTVSGSPTALSFHAKDQGNTIFTLQPIIGNTTKFGQIIASTTVAANTNPQFKIAANTDTGSASWVFITQAWVTPTTT